MRACAVIIFSMPFLIPLPCFLNLLLVGIDSWVKLHARMVVMLSKFNRIAVACCKKFMSIFYAYKEDKMANGISGKMAIIGKKANCMIL